MNLRSSKFKETQVVSCFRREEMILDRQITGQFSSLQAGTLARQKDPWNPTEKNNNNSMCSLSFTAFMFCPVIMIKEKKEAILYIYKPKPLLFDSRKKLPAPSTCVWKHSISPNRWLGTLPSPLPERRQGWQILAEEVVVQIIEKSQYRTCQKRLTLAEETLWH